MKADKMAKNSRSPINDATMTLGQLHDQEYPRDAIHLAVIQCIANEPLYKGDCVELVENNPSSDILLVRRSTYRNSIGIIDPFLSRKDEYLEEGDKFWVVLHPGSISSLRHVWSHPNIPDTPETLKRFPKTKTEPTKEQLLGAAALMGDKKAQAKLLLIEVADQLDISFEFLLDSLSVAYINNGDSIVHPDDSEYFEGLVIDDKVYEAFTTYTGRPVKSQPWNLHLDCYC